MTLIAEDLLITSLYFSNDYLDVCIYTALLSDLYILKRIETTKKEIKDYNSSQTFYIKNRSSTHDPLLDDAILIISQFFDTHEKLETEPYSLIYELKYYIPNLRERLLLRLVENGIISSKTGFEFPNLFPKTIYFVENSEYELNLVEDIVSELQKKSVRDKRFRILISLCQISNSLWSFLRITGSPFTEQEQFIEKAEGIIKRTPFARHLEDYIRIQKRVYWRTHAYYRGYFRKGPLKDIKRFQEEKDIKWDGSVWEDPSLSPSNIIKKTGPPILFILLTLLTMIISSSLEDREQEIWILIYTCVSFVFGIVWVYWVCATKPI